MYVSTGTVEAPAERKGLSWRTLWIDWRLLWIYTGPGWLMSLAYLDPGNLEADLQMGAYSGSALIWVLWWSTCAGLVLQLLAARLGAGTGRNLAQMCRARYPRCISHTLWVMTEIAIIGSDVQEIVGTAIAFQILFGFPLWVGALLTALDTFTFLGLHYFGIRKLEAFVCALILVMAVCFAM
jgi:natural resistance-associated macrophage protein